MNEGKRPGGLTALAVLNFIFSGGGLLGIMGTITMLALFGKLAENMDEQARSQWEAMQAIGRPMLIGLLALVGAIGFPPTARGDAFEDAWAAYERGDYARASDLWEPLAAGGSASAQINLGVLYEYGLGVDASPTEAARWYQAAADQGHGLAVAALERLAAEPSVGDEDSRAAPAPEPSTRISTSTGTAWPVVDDQTWALSSCPTVERSLSRSRRMIGMSSSPSR